MEIVRLSQDNCDAFSHLDPYEILNTLKNPNAFALGGIVSRDTDHPVALIIGMAVPGRIYINWLAVQPDYQEQGLGEQMLLKIFDIADKGDIPTVVALLGNDVFREQFSKSADTYFTDRMFDKSNTSSGWSFQSLESIGQSKYLSNNDHGLPKPVPLSTISATGITRMIDTLISEPECESLLSSANIKSLLDMDLSFVFMDNDDPCGALLILQNNGFLMPVMLYAESDREVESLVKHSYNAALSKYGKEQNIFIMTGTGQADHIHKQLLGQNSTGMALFADIADYRLHASMADTAQFYI